jgi:PASTA domain-containing protein
VARSRRLPSAWLGQIPALMGLVGGAVVASRVEAILDRRPGKRPLEPQPASPTTPSALKPATDTASGLGPPKRLFTRSSLLTLGLAVLTILVSFTLIEVVLGASLIGNRDTMFPSPINTVTARVPDVTGLLEGDARRQLDARGFRVEVGGERLSDLLRGFVASTSPAPGESADKGSIVTLWISNGQGVEVPDLAGTLVELATDKLLELGLVVGDVRPEPNEDVEVGLV